LLGFQWVERRVLIFGPPANATLRKPADEEIESDAVVTQHFESRAAAIIEWKGGALRHCCRTFPPSPPHTGRARFRAPGVPNSILPGLYAGVGVPFLPRHCSSGSSLLMGLVMRPTAACLGFTWNIEF
jgi:hypothetical protein